MDDTQIINLYFRRSELAITETDAKYGKYCFSIAERILASYADSEEIVNDTYLTAWNEIPPNRPPVLSVFLGKITRNKSIDRWRTQSAEKRGGTTFLLCMDELKDCISDRTDLEKNLELKETMNVLTRLLDSLPVVERKVFVCRYWYLDSVAEIAEVYGFTQTKVTTMLYRTRLKLRKLLEKEGLL